MDTMGRIKPTTVDGVLVVAPHDAVAAVFYLLAISVLYKFRHTQEYTSILVSWLGPVPFC